MDYPCAKFGDFSFSRFDFIVRTDRITDRQIHRITEAINAILTRLPSSWITKTEQLLSCPASTKALWQTQTLECTENSKALRYVYRSVLNTREISSGLVYCYWVSLSQVEHIPFCTPWTRSTGNCQEYHLAQCSWIQEDPASRETRRISWQYQSTVRHREYHTYHVISSEQPTKPFSRQIKTEE